MATWKRILTTDDGNLATSDQTIEAGENRNVIIPDSTLFTIKTSNVDGSLDNGALIQIQDDTTSGALDILTLQANTTKLRVTGATNSMSGSLSFKEADDNGSHMITLEAPASISSNLKFTLPGTDGSNGHALVTDGSGNLSFSAVSGGGGSIDGSGGTDRIAIWSDSDTLTSDSEITYSSGTHKITAGSFTAAVVTGVAATGVVRSQTLTSAEIDVGLVSVNTVGAFGIGSRLLVKGGSFQGTLSAGRVMRYSQGQGTNPITTADHTSSAAGTTMLFCTTDAVSPQELLLEGCIKMATNQGWSTAAQGTPLYLGASSGTVVSSPPTTQNYYSRIIGYVIDASNALIYFCPDRSWVKIS